MVLRALLSLVAFFIAAQSAATHAHAAPSPQGVESIASHHHATCPQLDADQDLCALCRSGRDLQGALGLGGSPVASAPERSARQSWAPTRERSRALRGPTSPRAPPSLQKPAV